MHRRYFYFVIGNWALTSILDINSSACILQKSKWKTFLIANNDETQALIYFKLIFTKVYIL